MFCVAYDEISDSVYFSRDATRWRRDSYVINSLRDVNKSKNYDKSANNCPTGMVHIWEERALQAGSIGANLDDVEALLASE